jgi:hypothetical protein
LATSSFANCFQNGILPIVVDKEIVDSLAADVQQTQGAGRYQHRPAAADDHLAFGTAARFAIDPRRRDGLLEGLDEVALTLQRDDEIRAFQAADRAERPWIHFARKRQEKGMNDRSNMIKVAVVGGEGIGPEVTAQSQRVLNWFCANRGVPMVLREAQYGIIPYLATGKVMPPDTVEAMEEADAILWGATGGPETKEVPAAARKAGSLARPAQQIRSLRQSPADRAPIRRWRIRRRSRPACSGTSISSSSAN